MSQSWILKNKFEDDYDSKSLNMFETILDEDFIVVLVHVNLYFEHIFMIILNLWSIKGRNLTI
jgi:hypothetical protein